MEHTYNNDKKIDSQEASKLDQTTHHILRELESFLENLKDDIQRSHVMLPMGIDTDLTAAIKKSVQDPISHLLTIRNDMTATIGSVLTLFVKKYFEKHNDIIHKAFRTETSNDNELHFTIVLKDDISENRSSILAFLRDYKSTELWEAIPVYFQFVPKELSSKVLEKEILIGNK